MSYDVLIQVIQRKNLAGIVVALKTAVGDFDGNVQFWHNKRHPADHRVVTEKFRMSGPEDPEFSDIPVIKVDSFVASRGIQNISFIKIDVQGYALAVCEGMKTTLESFPDLCVCLEYSPNVIAELGFEPTHVLDFFRQRNYNLCVLSGRSFESLPIESFQQRPIRGTTYVDLLFSKRRFL